MNMNFENKKNKVYINNSIKKKKGCKIDIENIIYILYYYDIIIDI